MSGRTWAVIILSSVFAAGWVAGCNIQKRKGAACPITPTSAHNADSVKILQQRIRQQGIEMLLLREQLRRGEGAPVLKPREKPIAHTRIKATAVKRDTVAEVLRVGDKVYIPVIGRIPFKPLTMDTSLIEIRDTTVCDITVTQTSAKEGFLRLKTNYYVHVGVLGGESVETISYRVTQRRKRWVLGVGASTLYTPPNKARVGVGLFLGYKLIEF